MAKMIYGLSGPDNRIVYIGTSKNDTTYVTSHHRASARSAVKDPSKSTPIREWIAQTGFYDFKAEELEMVEDADLEDRLAYWMDYCAANDIKLLNISKEEQLAKLKERMADPEVRARMLANRPKKRVRPEGWVKPAPKKTGRTISEAHKEAVRRAHTGKTVSEETRRKISEKAKGHKRNLGRVQSPEARLKMSHSKHLKHTGLTDFPNCRWCAGDDFQTELTKLVASSN